MRNASYFVILFPIDNYLHFPNEINKSNPLIVHKRLRNLGIKLSHSAYKCTQNN